MTQWQPIETAPQDGTTIDAYLPINGVNTLTRTRWLKDQGRWNGMTKGQEPKGWLPLPVPPTA